MYVRGTSAILLCNFLPCFILFVVFDNTKELGFGTILAWWLSYWGIKKMGYTVSTLKFNVTVTWIEKSPRRKLVLHLPLCLDIWNVLDRPSHNQRAYEYITKTKSTWRAEQHIGASAVQQADRLWEGTATETCAAWFDASLFQMQHHCLLFNPACVEAFGEFKHGVFCSSTPSLPCIFLFLFFFHQGVSPLRGLPVFSKFFFLP